MTERPDDRVPPADDDEPVLPDQTSDDTDRGWGDDDRDGDSGHGSNDERLLRERPPHW